MLRSLPRRSRKIDTRICYRRTKVNYWKITQYVALAIATTAIAYGFILGNYIYVAFGAALILAFVVGAINKRRKAD